MRHVLLVLTQSLDPLNDIVVAAEQTLPETEFQTIDLTVSEPDYRGLLDGIFKADSVQVW